MANDGQDIIALIQDLSVFGLVATVWLLAMLLWYWRGSAKRQVVQDRLQPGIDPGHGVTRTLRLWHDGKEATTIVPGQPLKGTIIERLEDLRREPGLDIAAKTLVLIFFGMCVSTFVLGLAFTRDILMSAGLSMAVVFCVLFYFKSRMKKRIDLFERQFIEALGLATRSLRAGHPLPAAFRLIAEEMRPPISIVFGKIWQEEAMGIGIKESIERTANESRSPDMRLFATATAIQLQSGGNLAEMMERLSLVIRARIRLHRRARILTAAAQFSKVILVGLPFVLFLILYILNKDYLEPLFTTATGKTMLVTAGGMMLIGIWVMNKIGELKY